MTDNSKTIELLNSTQSIIDERNNDKNLVEERFNIFSILDMETKENKTHSAFIAELLNPDGSHSQGNLFLKLFLEQININDFEANLSTLTLEKSIGPVKIKKKEPLSSSGGRIDIYLENINGKIISIENKINAPEQKLQLVRYTNHKRRKNKVYYLTLNGKSPSEFSTYTLKSGIDYFEITYRDHIIDWLEKSLSKISSSLLKESVRQYIVLIRQLTGRIDKKYMQKIHDVILNNYEATEKIIANANLARKIICQKIYNGVSIGLDERLKPKKELNVIGGNDVYDKNSKISIQTNNHKNKKLWFVVESFGGGGNSGGRMFVGIFNPEPRDTDYENYPNETSYRGAIINRKFIPKYKGYSINLSNAKTIQELHRNEVFKNEFINHIVERFVEYIDDEYPNLKRFLETGELPENFDLTEK